jgi:carbonic anhydrase
MLRFLPIPALAFALAFAPPFLRPARADEAAPPADLRARLAETLAKQQEPMKLLNPGRRAGAQDDKSKQKAGGKLNKKPPVAWGYAGEGAPEHWGSLAPENQLCAVGLRQSPIDLRDTLKVDLEPIAFDYRASTFSVQDTGRTLLVTPAPGNTLTVRQRRYELRSIEMRMPAETLVAGHRYNMAVHLLHRDAQGRQAILVLPVQQGDADQPALQRFWNHLPLEKHLVEAVPEPLDFSSLLPNERAYFTFMGSLSTPPCTEDVLWLVMREPLVASSRQLAVMQRLYPMNARPVQPAGGRLIMESF